ncbi:MAG TPA: DedA family protein [Jiangellales bacterium]|nr:DedA family protein [Jiangellales bacterium]
MLEAAMASPWVYLALFAAALLDAFLPVVPSEELVIIAAVFAAQGGEPNLVAVITVLAIGAIVGDHISYWVGSRTGRRFVRRLRPGSRLLAAFDSAERALSVRGGLLLVVARYIPGGRTVTTLTMGAIRYPPRRFALFDAFAAATWALYATLIGYLGGTAFANDPLKGLLFGLGLAAGVTVLVEIIRRVRRANSPAKTSGDVDNLVALRERAVFYARCSSSRPCVRPRDGTGHLRRREPLAR